MTIESVSKESMSNSLLIETPAPHVILFRINRPEARNALNVEVRLALAAAFQNLTPDIRCVIIAGNENFAAGADIRNMVECSAKDMMLMNADKYWRPITDCQIPIIAAVRGMAFGGGCELAMHADMIIAGDTAKFAQPEVKLGIMPGAGGTQRLMRAVGKFQAMKILLTGLPITASQAERMGLVSEMVADDQCEATALDYAVKIAELPPLAVRQIKDVALAGQDLSLDVALKLERKAFQLMFDTKDQKEGMRAFLEKRKPNYQGH
jgi:enoyl-CoA hydratase